MKSCYIVYFSKLTFFLIQMQKNHTFPSLACNGQQHIVWRFCLNIHYDNASSTVPLQEEEK